MQERDRSMFGFFKRTPLIEPAVMDWQFDCFEWLLKNTGGFKVFSETVLVQPSSQFFPQHGMTGPELAEALFLQVKEYAGMSDWPCKLEAQDEDPNPVVAPTLVVQDAPSAPAGTFSAMAEGVVITYNPGSISDPMSLIATFAHELSHYLTGSFSEEPPGGWENWEYAVDVTSVFLGFGIFAANSVVTFSQYAAFDSQGWRTSRSGYLSEAEVIHALGIFAALGGISQSEILEHLKPYLRGLYKRACRELLDQRQRIERLKEVGAVESHAIPNP